MMDKGMISRRLRLASSVGLALALAACGGGGGSVSSTPLPPPTSSPNPTPSPTPTPTPTTTASTSFDTTEFRRSDGPGQHNAVTAWQDGVTGAGTIIAVVDTGIDIDSPEFAGRVHPDSTDVAGNRGPNASEDDHGTNVAMVAAAARDGKGIMGIAFDAQVLALRADEPGTCGTDTSVDTADGCSFLDTDIADGVDYAVAKGASVVNLSLGGGAPSRTMLNAVTRASAAGLVVVVAAGNDGEAMPDAFASELRAAGGDNVIIVGSVDEANSISDFSNRAGSDAQWFLSARGEGVCCAYEDGKLFVGTDANGQYTLVLSGTSFAAPQVSGAVALLRQAFPNLTAAEIVNILLESAADLGAAGTDSIYGRGLLDIARAMQPAGTTTMAGSTSVVYVGDDTAIASPAMGDALGGQTVQSVITDKYDRAYAYDLAGGFKSAVARPRLIAALTPRGRYRAAGSDALSMAFTISDPAQEGKATWSRELRLSPEEAEGARVLAGRIAARLSRDTDIGMAFSESGHGLVAQLQGASRPAFLIARDAAEDRGFAASSDMALALRRQYGQLGLTLSAETGQAWIGNSRQVHDQLPGREERFDTRSFSIAADRKIGPIASTLTLTWMQEDRTMLGGYFAESLGGGGADSLFVDATATLPLRDWSFGASLRQGYTRAQRTGFIAGGSDFASNGWAVDVTRSGVFEKGDRIGLRVAQPLRVSGGGLKLDLPVSYDYATESAGYGTRNVSLSPTGREIVSELRWSGPLLDGQAGASVFYRHQPGHIADAPADAGIAATWSMQF